VYTDAAGRYVRDRERCRAALCSVWLDSLALLARTPHSLATVADRYYLEPPTSGVLHATDITTLPYPGFPTDMQPQVRFTSCVTLRARWVTLRARWVTLRARWVTLRARWVTLRASWVTPRARWVTLRAR
jgi:hypothetical protein